MVYVPPSSAQGAKRAITTRLRKLPLTKSERAREELKDEIGSNVEYLYALAKKAEKVTKIVEHDEE